MTVIFYEGRGQAMIQAEGIAKEFSKSIRFLLADGETITIKRKDIISIENNEEDKKVNKYQIIRSIEDENKAVILNDTEGRFFQGYDFMGSVDWVDRIADATWMDVEEAEMIIKDLIAADEPAEPEKPKTMKRIEILRALSAAHSAFRAELEKYGISMSGWRVNEPYTLYIDNGPTKPITILGEYDYKQKINESIH